MNGFQPQEFVGHPNDFGYDQSRLMMTDDWLQHKSLMLKVVI